MTKIIKEAFATNKVAKGVVKFLEHTFHDPHIKKAIQLCAAHLSKSISEIEEEIQKGVLQFEEMAKKAPLLCETNLKNIIEDQIFTMMWQKKIPVPEAPTFNKIIFSTLFRTIKGEHPKFFPMRSTLSAKELVDNEPILVPTNQGDDLNKIYKNETKSGKIDYNQVTTAACYPSGQFVFNTEFMQSLLDFAFLKGLKPNGRKYRCNSGFTPDDREYYKFIPDEYGYIEFLIIHEFFHFTQDDFHYQKIIPKAQNKVINYVGDFRSNYLLVKSGYSQLPLGLYNDNINYDRQYTYEEMYKLVKEEFDKLTPDEEDELDKRTDNHEGGQEEGENMDEGEDESGEGGKPSKGKGEGKPSGKAGDEEGESGSGVSKSILDKIDEHYRNSEKALSEKEDLTPQEAAAKEKEKAAGKAAGKGGRGTGGNTETKLMDMSGGEAHYAWRELIRKFIATAAEPEPEETRARPARNIGSTMHTVMQGGMAAAPPGEVLTEDNDTKLCFVVDSSGSMSGAVKDIYANINSLLSNNSRIGNKIFAMLRFSETYEMFRAIFKGNKAVKVNDFKEIPSKFDLRLDTVFNSHYGSSTNLTSTIVDELLVLKKAGYNLILFSDSDVCSGENLDELASLVRAPGGKVFIILKSKSDWSMLEKSGKIDMTFVSNLYDEVQH